MLEIKYGEGGDLVLTGRFDASEADKASRMFDSLTEPTVVDLSGLEYISSLGLGVLLKTQKRLRKASGSGLKLVRVHPHVNDIFMYSGFHQIFEIEVEPA
jgi:anti-anti-sigma factor